MKITVINTGGTFNKRYNPIKGALEVPSDNLALDKILKACHNIEFEILNVVSKDSLEMDEQDRELIAKSIQETKNNKIIIIHGTDTVDVTAAFLKERVKDKIIVFTGAMVPMSIETVEATLNFSMAVGFLNANVQNGIYLSMHGAVSEASKLVKNRAIGEFLLQK